jgi:hypothetical protein
MDDLRDQYKEFIAEHQRQYRTLVALEQNLYRARVTIENVTEALDTLASNIRKVV